MSPQDTTLDRILRGTADAAIRFSDLCSLLRRLGFEERIRGDHHVFTRQDVPDLLNIQPKGAMAKPYQVKQVRNLILRHRLGAEHDSV